MEKNIMYLAERRESELPILPLPLKINAENA
jgi:hypothetical protein